jgi:hypothetical protein
MTLLIFHHHCSVGGKVGKVTKAHTALFNDLLLICHPKSKEKYKIAEEVVMDAEISIQDIAHSKGK